MARVRVDSNPSAPNPKTKTVYTSAPAATPRFTDAR